MQTGKLTGRKILIKKKIHLNACHRADVCQERFEKLAHTTEVCTSSTL